MGPLSFSSLVAVLPILVASASEPRPQGVLRDDARTVLSRRAERPAQPAVTSPTGPHRPAGTPRPYPTGIGNRLFSMVGIDNAECVRAIPDVTGDGRDEIVVGIGRSGVPNVFCLDGGSAGTASVVWSLQTASGVSGGSCYGDQSIVPVPDTGGDGHADVLVGTAWGGRTAFDFDTLAGGEEWRYDTYVGLPSGWVYSLARMSDVTGDGVTEFAFGAGSDADAVVLVDGAKIGQAHLVWRYAAGDAVYSVRNVGDVNADGTDDVLAAVGDNIDRIVCLEGDSTSPGGHVLWNHNPGTSVFACGVLSDITGDGADEAIAVLWTSNGSAIRCLNGATGTLVWSSTLVLANGMAVDELPDVTGDGKNEVIVSSWENAVSVLSGANGSLLWKRTVGTLNGGDVWSARALGDVDGDGKSDVVAGSFDYKVYALNGVTGDVFWTFDTGNRVFSVSPVGDLNGDGWPDVVAGTQDTNSSVVVHVLEGDSGLR